MILVTLLNYITCRRDCHLLKHQIYLTKIITKSLRGPWKQLLHLRVHVFQELKRPKCTLRYFCFEKSKKISIKPKNKRQGEALATKKISKNVKKKFAHIPDYCPFKESFIKSSNFYLHSASETYFLSVYFSSFSVFI